MNSIEKIRDDLVGRFPNLRIKLDPPALENGSWDLDIFREGGLDFVNVEWRPDRGFGVTTPGPDDYGTGVDEVYGSPEATFRRVVHLVETGESTVPPEAVRLAEQAGVGPASPSRVEGRDDLTVSTLARVAEAMGATLSIKARFPDGSERELEF